MTSAFWIKFLHESDLSVDENTLQKYATALTNRYSTVEELLSADENELSNVGITNELDRACLIKQAHLIDDKENLPLTRQSTASHYLNENWLGATQSTPLNPKSKCSLSPALLSRISFNDHPTYEDVLNINKQSHFDHTIETPKRIIPIDNNDKIKTLLDSCPKIISPTSAHGMRAIKSLSDTISLQKKVIVGSDRLKRLTLSRTLFKRHTAMITKKVSNITNKLRNSFSKFTDKNDLKAIDNRKTISKNEIIIENMINCTQENAERRKVQLLSLNSELTDFNSCEDNEQSKHNVHAIQTLPTRRFKLGAPTTFLTRSLVNHSQIE